MGAKSVKSKYLKALGIRLKELRTQKNLTLKELGYLADKDPQSINRVEMGDVNPSFYYLVEICQALEIDLAELLKDLPLK